MNSNIECSQLGDVFDFMYKSTVNKLGHLQIKSLPPSEAEDGEVWIWKTNLCPIVDLDFGEPTSGTWELKEDNRKVKLYLEDGSEYTIDNDHDGDSYNGIGDIPDWLSKERPDPEPQPEPIPHQVTRAQGKAALITAGLWQQVLDYVDGITDPTEKALAEVALNDTTHWQRDSPFLNNAAIAIGLSSEQLDDLFKQASRINL